MQNDKRLSTTFNALIRRHRQTEVFTSFNIPETSVAEKKSTKVSDSKKMRMHGGH